MKNQAKQKTSKKIVLALSLSAILILAILATGASLAWFTDTSEDVKNIFHFAEFELEVSHRLDDGTWETIDGKTDIFDEEALYEPGYVQVVYLKVDNNGTVPFNFYTAVSVNNYTTATNVFGDSFDLPDHLKFGVTNPYAEEDDMYEAVKTRELAKAFATSKLNNYYETDAATLAAGSTSYLALIVYMPEEVDNIANYRGDDIPQVELGIIVTADQIQ